MDRKTDRKPASMMEDSDAPDTCGPDADVDAVGVDAVDLASEAVDLAATLATTMTNRDSETQTLLAPQLPVSNAAEPPLGVVAVRSRKRNRSDDHLDESSSSSASTSSSSPVSTSSYSGSSLSSDDDYRSGHREGGPAKKMRRLEMLMLDVKADLSRLHSRLDRLDAVAGAATTPPALSGKPDEEEKKKEEACMSSLPEHLLLRVLSLLPSWELFSCGLVCSAWRRLVRGQNPLAWKLWAPRQAEYSGPKDERLFLLLMEVAPCLSAVTCRLSREDKPIVAKVLARTRCIFPSLRLELEHTPPSLLDILWNFRSKTPISLTVLEHLFCNITMSANEVRLFWWLIDSMKALRELVVLVVRLSARDEGDPACSIKLSPSAAPGRLERLSLTSLIGPSDVNAVELIRSNRATLQSVIVSDRDPRVVDAIALCREVSDVSVCATANVTRLEACKKLDVLEIRMEGAQDCIPQVVQLLHSCRERLLDLTLSDVDWTPKGRARVLVVLPKLKELRRLRIWGADPFPEAAQLYALLRGLPQLHALTLCNRLSPAVLEELADCMAPALRELHLDWNCDDDDLGCRVPALRRLLERRPDLHVANLESSCPDKGHVTAKGAYEELVVTGHPLEQDCDVCAKAAASGKGVMSIASPAWVVA